SQVLLGTMTEIRGTPARLSLEHRGEVGNRGKPTSLRNSGKTQRTLDEKPAGFLDPTLHQGRMDARLEFLAKPILQIAPPNPRQTAKRRTFPVRGEVLPVNGPYFLPRRVRRMSSAGAPPAGDS